MPDSIPILNIYYLLCYACNALDRDSWVKIDPERIKAPQDLLAKLLTVTVKILLKRGLACEYVGCSGEVAGIRGKLEVTETISRIALSRARTWCSYDERLPDTAPNRAILSAMNVLLRCSEIQTNLREELYRLIRYFGEVRMVPLSPALCDNIRLDRNTRYYHFAIDICALVARNTRPSETDGRWFIDDFSRNPAQMNRLFESFVRNFYRLEQKVYTVSAPKISWQLFPDKPGDELYIPEMRTDIVLETKDTRMIIDTKFYRSALLEYRGKISLNPANLYQMTAYLSNAEDVSDMSQWSTGILLYPQNGPKLDLSYRYGTHRVRICTVNLQGRWDTIHERLLEIVGIRKS